MKKYLNLFKWWEVAFVLFALVVVVVLAIVFSASVQTILTTIFAFIGIALLAKGLVLGNVVMIIQCIFYAWMNAKNQYFGEVICSVCISVPLYIFVILSWIKKRTSDNVVLVNTNLKTKDYLFGALLAVILTTAMFFVMQALNTANLAISTFSVFLSIFETYLSIRRSSLSFVLTVLRNACLFVMWILIVVQTGQAQYYVTITHTCFSIIFNAYAIFNWQKMKNEQNSDKAFNIIMRALK